MAQQTINVGTAPNDGTGTPLRTAFQYTNSNFSELYTAVGPSGNNIVVPGNATITGDLTVRTTRLTTTTTGVGIGTATPILPLDVRGTAGAGALFLRTTDPTAPVASAYIQTPVSTGFSSTVPMYGFWYQNCGMGNPAAENLSWIINSSEAMRLNATGLGVGVASPQAKIHIANASMLIETLSTQNKPALALGSLGAYYGLIQNDGTGLWSLAYGSSLTALGTPVLSWNSSGNVGIGVTPSAWSSGLRAINFSTNGVLYANGGNSAFFGNNYYNDGAGTNRYLTNNVAAAYGQVTGEHQWFTAPSGTAGNAITFTQAMTLDASGTLLVGTTSAGASGFRCYLSTDSGTTKWSVGPYVSATNFAIVASGSAGGVYLNGTTATSWTALSDERFKDIIEPISNAVAKVGSLRAVIGKIKGDETNTRKSFLIAQDVESVLPEAVDASNPDRLGLAYTDVIPLLVAAIKELTARVQTLETR